MTALARQTLPNGARLVKSKGRPASEPWSCAVCKEQGPPFDANNLAATLNWAERHTHPEAP